MTRRKVRPKSEAIRVRVPRWMMNGSPKAMESICGWSVDSTGDPDICAPRHHALEEDPGAPDISSEAFLKAAQWWINQLSTLFSIISEPSNYEDEEGYFDPAAATERLLSVEQMFRDCQSILTITRNDHARRALAFNFLTRLQGIVPGYSWKDVVGRTSLERIAGRLRNDLPQEVQAVFLGRADRAVRVVTALEDGFFLPLTEDDGRVPLPDRQGKVVPVERRTAVTEWLSIVRNSLHGFDAKPSRRHRALLAAHNGHIPGEFSDVAWLHLLDLLAHPEKLAKFEMHKRGRAKQMDRQCPLSGVKGKTL